MGKPALQLPFTLGPVSPSRQVSSRQLGPGRARGLAAAASSRRRSLASGSSRASSDRLDLNSVSEFAPTPSSLSVSRIHSAHSSQPSDTGLEHVRVRQMHLPSADCLLTAQPVVYMHDAAEGCLLYVLRACGHIICSHKQLAMCELHALTCQESTPHCRALRTYIALPTVTPSACMPIRHFSCPPPMLQGIEDAQALPAALDRRHAASLSAADALSWAAANGQQLIVPTDQQLSAPTDQQQADSNNPAAAISRLRLITSLQRSGLEWDSVDDHGTPEASAESVSARPGRQPSPVAATVKSFSMPKPVRRGDWPASDDEIPLRVLHTPRHGSDAELREVEAVKPEQGAAGVARLQL